MFWGWFTIKKFFIIIAFIILSSCAKSEEAYQAKNIEIKENQNQGIQKSDEIQVNGLYELKKDSYMYEFPEKWSKYDKLEKGSTVQVLREAEEGFVWVDYSGNQGYVEVDLLEEV